MAPLACITLSKSIYKHTIPTVYRHFIASEKALAPVTSGQASLDRSFQAFAHVKRLVFTDYVSWGGLLRMLDDERWELRPSNQGGPRLLPNVTSIHIHQLAIGLQPEDPLVSPIVRTISSQDREQVRLTSFKAALWADLPAVIDKSKHPYQLVFHVSHRWPSSERVFHDNLSMARPETVTLVCGPEACTSFATVTSLERFPPTWNRGKERHFVWDTRAVSKASEGVEEGAEDTEVELAWRQATGAVEGALLSLARRRVTEGPSRFPTAHFYHVVDAKARKKMLLDWIDQNGMGYPLSVQSDLREYVEGSVVELSDEYAEEVGLL